jgi:hypothetical protein
MSTLRSHPCASERSARSGRSPRAPCPCSRGRQRFLHRTSYARTFTMQDSSTNLAFCATYR